ncbi:MAG: hypothetical protein LBE08_00950, partial [Bifidobacteriaceae bacterium]|nr:hypothetical protein [Bifidobacteriaceae bacterium]
MAGGDISGRGWVEPVSGPVAEPVTGLAAEPVAGPVVGSAEMVVGLVAGPVWWPSPGLSRRDERRLATFVSPKPDRGDFCSCPTRA